MISIRDLSHGFQGKPVLKNVSLEVNPGEIVAIMGSSGGGKTTLLRCVAGLIKPDKGRVEVAGVDVRRQPEEARRHMSMVFQSAALLDYLNVWDNVVFGLRRRMHGKKADFARMTAEALERVGLTGSEKLMPSELSGGMKKRVGMARALVLNPKVMLYDEPTTGLDPITAYSIDRLIASLRDNLGVTSLVVSHDVTGVFRVADRIAFLNDGELSYVGDRKGFEESKDPDIRELVTKSCEPQFMAE